MDHPGRLVEEVVASVVAGDPPEEMLPLGQQLEHHAEHGRHTLGYDGAGEQQHVVEQSLRVHH